MKTQYQQLQTPLEIVLHNCYIFLNTNNLHFYFTNEEFFIYTLRIQTLYKEGFELLGTIEQIDDDLNQKDHAKLKFIPKEEQVQSEFSRFGKKFAMLVPLLNKIVILNLFNKVHGIVWDDIRISQKTVRYYYKIIPRKTSGRYGTSRSTTTNQYTGNTLQSIISFARGIFSTADRGYIRLVCFCELYINKFRNSYQNRYLKYTTAALVMPRRIPLLDIHKNLIGFQFKQFIEIFLSNKRYEVVLKDRIRQLILDRYKNDHDCLECFNPNYVLPNVPLNKRSAIAYSQNESIVVERYNQILNDYVYYPKEFEPQYLQQDFAKNYKKLQNGRFHYDMEFEQIQDKFKNANEYIVDVVSDERGAEQLLRLIKSIPSLKFRLTIEQEKMISTPNNLLCLGRSGTGKTTSSALRLFSTDVFYKYMEELRIFKKANPEALNQDFVIDPNFLNKPTQLRLVFVTFSPVLTNEVKKFYEDTKDHFIKELIKRRERQAKKKQQNIEEEKKQYEIDESMIEEIDDLNDSKFDNSTQANEQMDFEAYLKLEKDILEDDDNLERQMKLPFSIDGLNSDHFPLFVTVRRLIYMLDASLQFSFFSRNNEGQIVGMESSVEWHNENRGVFMINHYYKAQKDYDEKIKKLGTKLIQMDEDIELDELKDIDDDEEPEILTNQQQEPAFNVSSGLGNLINTNSAFVSPTYNITGRQLSFEVDFEIFKNRFWPKVANWTKLVPLVVWTEIYSVIKGGADIHNYDYCTLPFSVYISRDTRYTKKLYASRFLDVKEKVMIYQIFMHYEKWKQNMGAYDFNDVVNHIITQTRFGLKSSQYIHFLMVDEVQDLTPNVLNLLTYITQRNIFFCGDTAQTIAKGIGFRFYDLKSIFKFNPSLNVPSVLQLTKNFRSHSKILDLANSVVSLIELLFPKTIDKLLKETSEIDGPKPIFIDPANSNDQLRNLLFGRAFQNVTQSDISQGQIDGSSAHKPQFGCNQVIIVRDQESKQRVPDFLQNMLCLTVYEAKGLEFDDVILFNFFEDSKCGNQWMLMKDIDFDHVVIKKFKEFDFLNFDDLDIEEKEVDESNDNEELEEKDKIKSVHKKDDEEVVVQLKLMKNRAAVYRQYAQLCTELKFLYVAITRPKKVLIIYDTENTLRKPIQDIWQKIGLISVVNKEMLHDNSQIPIEVTNVLTKDISNQLTSEEQWRWQGIMLFKKKFYLSAIQCFRNAGDKNLEIRCMAYQHADKAQTLLGESDSKLIQSKNKMYKKSERNQMVREAKEMKEEAHKELEQAGHFFEKIQMARHAAQCYCTAQKMDKAAKMFESMVDYGQSAECYLKTGDVRKAADFYAKAGLFANAFECYERMQDWEGLLMCLSKNKDYFKKEERQSLIEKYFPIALNQLYHLYSSLDPSIQSLGGLDEENKGKFQEMKIKLKFQKSVSVIREENDEYDESSSEEEEEIKEAAQEQEQTQDNIKLINDQDNQIETEKEQLQEQQQQEQLVTEEEESKIEVINQSEDFELIDTCTKPDKEEAQEEKKNMFDYFDDDYIKNKIEVEEANDQMPVSKENIADQFEVLSSMDPDDEFLQSGRSVSLIESIVSKNSNSFSVISSQSSEFSIIGNSKLHSIIMSVYSGQDSVISHKQIEESKHNESLDFLSNISEISQQQSAISLVNSSRFSTIQNERDQYAEDIVMQKIIFYVSLFSDDVKSRLQTMRSKDTLGHLEVNLDDQFGFDNQFMFIDLDDISQELLYLILDTLEHYELFRLCLIICNRYQLKDKVARYLISIGNKYSNLKNFKFSFLQKLTKVNELQAQQTYSLIAHEAMHNVLALVEKDFLKLDEQGKDTINLRDNCFDFLFMQGFWKKLVFLMDSDSALELARAMGDKESFKLLYLVYRCGIKDGQEIRDILTNSNNNSLLKYLQKDVNQTTKILASEILISDDIDYFKSRLIGFYKALQDKNSNQKELSQYMNLIRELITKKAREYNKKSHDYIHMKRIAAYMFSLIPVQYQNSKDVSSFLYPLRGADLELIKSYLMKYLKVILEKEQIVTKKQKLQKQKILPSNIKEELKRMALMPFGVTSLDGLELFKKFKDLYYIVSKNSILIKQIYDKQEKAICEFNNDQVYQLYNQNINQYQNVGILKNYVKQQVDKVNKNIESNVQFNQLSITMPCDLNLDFFLVPKKWIEEIVLAKTLNFCTYLNQIIEGYYDILSDKVLMLGQLLQYKGFIITQSKFIKVRQEKERVIYFRQQAIHQQVQVLLRNTQLDSMPGMIERSIQKTEDQIKLVKSQVLDRNKFLLAIDQSISMMPYDKNRNRVKSETTVLEKEILIELALAQQNEAFKVFTNKEKFFSSILKAFSLFALADEYIYLLERLRGKKKYIVKNEKVIMHKTQMDIVKTVYLLLDSHVYLKNNLWTSAIDSIYAFLNSTFNFITFREILYLLEGAFYRSILQYYIYRNNQKRGVLIPDFGMVNIEPLSNYQCRHLNKEQTLYEVINLEYHELKIDRAPDIKMISEAFYWMQILINTINKDFEAFLFSDVYQRVYYMVMTFFVNTSEAELQKNQKLVQRIKAVAHDFVEAPIDSSLKRLVDWTDKASIIKSVKFVQSKSEQKLFQNLRYEHKKGSSGGFVRITDTGLYDKEMNKLLQKFMDKAYYQEMQLLAKRMASAHYICRIYKEFKKIRQKQKADGKLKLNKVEFDSQTQELIQNYSEVINPIREYIKKGDFKLQQTIIQKITQCLEVFDKQIRRIIHFSMSKLVINSLDLHYLKSKLEIAQRKKSDFQMNLKELINQKYQPEILQQFIDLSSDFSKQIDDELKTLEQWLGQVAEPNIIEIEKKQLNIRNKWETLINFQKKKRLLLKHFSKNRK